MLDKVVKHELGYFEYKEKPTLSELNEYYSKKYYQESQGAYQSEYDSEEILFFNNKIEQKYSTIIKEFEKVNYSPLKLSLLDVGCGEGWALNFFKKQNWDVLGLDYSSFGCLKCNPDCVNNLKVGDIYESLKDLQKNNYKYDVIWLTNVLEHVLNPIELLQELKNLISNHGILLIQVPNDFSKLQLHLLNNNIIDRPFWIAIPDHISYFTKDSLQNIAEYCGWEIKSFSTNYPIDINLFNENTNYILDKTKGKSVHRARVKLENFLHDQSRENVNHIFESIANAGLGRDLIAFMTLKK